MIVASSMSISKIQFEKRIVVQIKSYTGKHYDLDAVEQIERAIKEFDVHARMIIPTAARTKELEEKIEEISKKSKK